MSPAASADAERNRRSGKESRYWLFGLMRRRFVLIITRRWALPAGLLGGKQQIGQRLECGVDCNSMWYLAEMVAVDFFVSTVLVALTIIMSYLGTTLHPQDDSPPVQFWYKFSICVCGLCAVSLVIWQGIRTGDAARQVITLQGDLTKAKNEAQSALQETVKERTRRQQVERDLAILQNSGSTVVIDVASLKPIVVKKIERVPRD